MHHFLITVITLLLSSNSDAGIEVNAWSRATPSGGTTAAIYGRFTNNGDIPMTVTSVQVDFADQAMVHDSRHEEGMVSMRTGELVIPAAGIVELKSNGKHIMLMGLSGKLREGCNYSFRLNWSDNSTTLHRFLTGSIVQLTPPKPLSTKSCK